MPDRRRRVALTGIGAITPIGIGRDALWAGIRAERSAVRTLTRFDPSPFRSRVAAQVDDFHAADHLEARRAKRLDRFAQFSVAAARLPPPPAGPPPPPGGARRRRAPVGGGAGGG